MESRHTVLSYANIYLCYVLVQTRRLICVSTTDYLTALRLVASRPLHGVMMSIQEMSLPTAVQVHGIRGLNTSYLSLYFATPENGGDALVDLRETESDDCVIVEYQSSEGTYIYIYMSAENVHQSETS